MNPRVSVVIPAFNPRRDKLTRTIASVLGQSFQDLEVIVVDDGSVEPFSGVNDDYPELSWVALPQNQGVAAARNIGAAKACGELLAFLDVGDWWEPDKLARQVEAYDKNPNAGLIFCGVFTHNGSQVGVHPGRQLRDFYRELLVRQCVPGSASSVLIPKRLYQDVGGFYAAEDIPEDRDLWLRLAREHPFVAVEEPLVHIEVVPESRSSDPRKKETTYLRFLGRHEAAIKEAGLWGEAMCHYYLVIGQKYLHRRDWLQGAIFMGRALLASPGHILKKVAQRIPRL